MKPISAEIFLEDADFDLCTDAMLHIDGGDVDALTDGDDVRIERILANLVFDDGKSKQHIKCVDLTHLFSNPPNSQLEELLATIHMKVIDKYWELDRAERGVDHWSELRFDTSREGA